MGFVFGTFDLDLERRELRHGGVVRPLEPKAFTVLAYLLMHRAHAVSKDELLDTCWPGEFVSEAALTRCVRVIRRAVADDGGRQQVIKTLRGYGYRFVAEVEASSARHAPIHALPHAAPAPLDREAASLDLVETPGVLAAHGTMAPAFPTAPPALSSSEQACSQCQTPNRAARQFCAACGQVLWHPCPQCGFRNSPAEHSVAGAARP